MKQCKGENNLVVVCIFDGGQFVSGVSFVFVSCKDVLHLKRSI